MGRNPMTWDDIGCGYGEMLTVTTKRGGTYTGILIDFELAEDGNLGEDSISLKTDEIPSITFPESTIAEIRPLG